MRRHRVSLWLLVSAGVPACAPAADFALPWWPAPRVAAASPLLDAAGLAPPALAGPRCHRDGIAAGRGARGALARFATGFGVTCFVLPAAGADPAVAGAAAVTFDSRGQAWSADRRTGRLPAAQAAAAADSVVRRGLRLPGARPLACGIARWPAGFAGPGAPEAAVVLRGWRTPDYEALVTTEPAWPGPVGTRAVHVEVSRLGFAACRPALVTAGARTAA